MEFDIFFSGNYCFTQNSYFDYDLNLATQVS